MPAVAVRDGPRQQQQLHGIVSLRISRPRFPWPPLGETVTEAVDRLLADDRTLTCPAPPR